jgi:hypothetical protein
MIEQTCSMNFTNMPMNQWWSTNFPDYPIWLIPLAGILGVVIFIIVDVILLRYLVSEAKRVQITNFEIWVVLFAVFNVIGLILYLLVREVYPTKQNTNSA